MIQFLIDEDVTPKLRDVANARGYNAYHIQYLDWKGREDFAIRSPFRNRGQAPRTRSLADPARP